MLRSCFGDSKKGWKGKVEEVVQLLQLKVGQWGSGFQGSN